MNRTLYTVQRAFVALLALGALSSCYKDDSTGVTHPLQVVEPTTQLQELYEVEFGAPLEIEAPTYRLTNGATTTPTIEWEVDYKKVATGNKLVYKATSSSDYGVHVARLKMETPDGIYYHRFRIRVNFKYRDGLYALTQQEGKLALGYYPFGEASHVVTDVFTEGKLDRDLTGTPKVLDAFSHTTGAGVTTNYLFVGGDTWAYRLNADSIKPIGGRMNFNGHPMQAHAFSPTDINEYVIAEGKLYTLGLLTSLPRLLNDNRLKSAFANKLPVLAPELKTWRASNLQGGLIAFDQTTGTPIIMELSNTGNKVHLLKATYTSSDDAGESTTGNPFEGSSLIALSANASAPSHVAILAHSAQGSYKLAVIDPGLFLSAKKEEKSYPLQVITYKGTDTPTQLALRPEHNSAYVAAANKVYLYDLQRQVQAAPEAYITLGAGETIQRMILEGGTRLYIATYDGSASAVYSYDVSGSTAKQLWRDASLGKVVQLVYRAPR